MFRIVLQPTSTDVSIPIPHSWFGQKVEIIAFPLTEEPQTHSQIKVIRDKGKRTVPMEKKYLFSTKNFKFSRDEANDYE
ncbi:MAG: hypothetical protein LBE91_20980 [Tannerella sp.]|jgi:hypothetical protein|nr:hypothetical protein [Tannerella sp.]